MQKSTVRSRVSVQQTRDALAVHGELRFQSECEWTGPFVLPGELRAFYAEVGPVGVAIAGYGNPYYLPSLSELWRYQAGYRFHGLTGAPLLDWNDDWVAVADEGGDPFILSRSTGEVLHAQHGLGGWAPDPLFSDINEMACSLAALGAAVELAAETSHEGELRTEVRDDAARRLLKILGSSAEAGRVMRALGWWPEKESR